MARLFLIGNGCDLAKGVIRQATMTLKFGLYNSLNILKKTKR